ncbi:MAG: efflux RND transporter periplasmic adaptor subunit, partial [Aggregatilineales bacterium]
MLILIISACTLSVGDTQVDVGSVGGDAVAQAQIPTVTPIPTAPAAARTTYTVQRGSVQNVFEFRGRWLPRDQAQLSFEVAGTVRSVNVRRDDTVGEGALLADLQIDNLENQLVTQQLNLERAQRNLASGGDNSEDSALNAQFALANSRLSLQGQRATVPWTQVQDALDNIEAAERDLLQAERDYNEAISRADSSAATVSNAYQTVLRARDTIDQRQRSYQSAVASYYQSTLNIQQQENQVLQNELSLQDALQGGGDPDLVQAVNEAQIAIDQTEEEIRKSSLFSPIEGVVLEVVIQPGDSVQAFNTVLTVAIPDPKEAIANLAFNEIQQLQVGQVGVCAVVNQPETAVQCIIRQLPLSNRDVDQTVRVAAIFDEVQSGQLIEVEMVLEDAQDVLWLPPAAINTFQNRTFVVLQTPEGERVQDVEVGLQTDDRVEIRSGLNEG